MTVCGTWREELRMCADEGWNELRMCADVA